MKKNYPVEFVYQALSLIVAMIIVHAVYVLIIRPQADAVLAEQQAMMEVDDNYVQERSVYVIIRDFEQEACFILMLWAMAIMASKGLKQGVNGLKVYAMCEIPSNVMLADEFLKVFDGYSIGSNDLTQLTLGVDRDSDLVAHVFDERNLAVKRMLKMAIDACNKADKYIGICGQAPSDYPEITKFLVENRIDSISLNPDSVVKTWKLVTELESGNRH